MTSGSALPESDSKHRTYNRKQKSLGLLCSNFVGLYDRAEVDLIGLDDAASRLGVERRRIYDIVNVLESVGVLERKAKNKYLWKGFKALPFALQQLKEEASRENFIENSFQGLDDHDNDDETSYDPDASNSHYKSGQTENPRCFELPMQDNRREKSLSLLTQNFVKLFLCSSTSLMTLEEAARILLGDAQNSSAMRTKVRRLYDIANVLSSMGLIQKTQVEATRKPAFRWLGMEGKAQQSNVDGSHCPKPGKRKFGAELTNVSGKRKADASNIKTRNQRPNVHDPSVVRVGATNSSHSDPHRTTLFEHVLPLPASTDNSKNTSYHLGSLASTYRVQYRNDALKDLFLHYLQAWKSWYLEIAKDRAMQAVS